MKKLRGKWKTGVDENAGNLNSIVDTDHMVLRLPQFPLCSNVNILILKHAHSNVTEACIDIFVRVFRWWPELSAPKAVTVIYHVLKSSHELLS